MQLKTDIFLHILNRFYHLNDIPYGEHISFVLYTLLI